VAGGGSTPRGRGAVRRARQPAARHRVDHGSPVADLRLETRVTTVAVVPGWREDLAASSRRVAAVVTAGLVAGVAIGGVGGRLAMLLLRLTSSDAVRGLESDDGFVIGRFSGETLFLLLFTGMLGVLGSLAYLAVRAWIPAGSRAAWTGVFGAAVGGSAVVHPDGIDFNLLQPLWLAVALFVALPALYGVAMSVLVERGLRGADEGRGGRLWFLGLLPFLAIGLFGPIGIAILLLIVGAWWLGRSVPAVVAFWRSPPVVWTGRAILLAFTAWSAWLLVRDAAEIL
jgi:hypothetical protein